MRKYKKILLKVINPLVVLSLRPSESLNYSRRISGISVPFDLVIEGAF